MNTVADREMDVMDAAWLSELDRTLEPQGTVGLGFLGSLNLSGDCENTAICERFTHAVGTWPSSLVSLLDEVREMGQGREAHQNSR